MAESVGTQSEVDFNNESLSKQKIDDDRFDAIVHHRNQAKEINIEDPILYPKFASTFSVQHLHRHHSLREERTDLSTLIELENQLEKKTKESEQQGQSIIFLQEEISKLKAQLKASDNHLNKIQQNQSSIYKDMLDLANEELRTMSEKTHKLEVEIFELNSKFQNEIETSQFAKRSCIRLETENISLKEKLEAAEKSNFEYLDRIAILKEDLEKSLNNKETAPEPLQLENERLNEDIQSYLNLIETLEHDIDKLDNVNEFLQSEVNNLSKEKNQLMEANDSLRLQIEGKEELSSRFLILEEKQDQTNQNLHNTIIANQILKEERNTYQQKIRELENQLDGFKKNTANDMGMLYLDNIESYPLVFESQAPIDEFKSSLEQRDTVIEELERKIQNLLGQLSESTLKITEMEKIISDTEIVQKKKEWEIDELRTDLKNLEAKFKREETDNNSLKTQVSSSNSSLPALLKTIDDLKFECKKTQLELNAQISKTNLLKEQEKRLDDNLTSTKNALNKKIEEISDLRIQISKMKLAYDNQVSELQGKLRQIDDINSKTNHIDSIVQKNESLKLKSTNLKNKIQVLENRQEQLEDELENERNLNYQNIKEKGSLSSELERVMGQLKFKTERLETLKEKISYLEDENLSLIEKLSASERELIFLKSNIKEKERTFRDTELQKELENTKLAQEIESSLYKKIKELETENTSLNIKVSYHNQVIIERDSLLSQLTSSTEEKNRMERDLDSFNKEIKIAKDRFTQAEEERDKYKSEFEDKSLEAQTLQSELELCTFEIERSKKKILSLQVEQAELNNSIFECEQQIEQLSNENVIKDNSIRNLRLELAEKQHENDHSEDTQKSLQALRTELSQLKAENQRLILDRDHLKKEFSSLKESYSSTKQQSEEVNTLKCEFDIIQKDYKELEKENKALNLRLKQSRNELSVLLPLPNKIRDLEEELHQIESLLQAEKEMNRSLNKRNKDFMSNKNQMSYETNISELKEDLEKASIEIKDLLAERDALQQRILSIEIQNQSNEAQSAFKKRYDLAIKNEEDLKKELQTVNASLNQVARENESLSHHIEQAGLENEKLKKDIKNEYELRTQAENDIKRFEVGLDNIIKELEAKKQEVESLEKKLKNETSTAARNIAEQIRKLELAELKIDGLQYELQLCKQEIDDLNNQQNSNKKSNKREVNEIKSKFVDLKNELENSKEERNQYRDLIVNLEADIEEKNRELANSKEKKVLKNTSSRDRSESDSRIQQMEEKLAERDSQIDEMMDELAFLRNDLDLLNEKNQNLTDSEDNINSLKQENESNQFKIKKLEEIIQNLKKKNSELKFDLEKQKACNNNLSIRLSGEGNSIKHEFERKEEEYSSKIREYQSRVSELEEELREHEMGERKLNELNKALNFLKDELDNRIHEIEVLREREKGLIEEKNMLFEEIETFRCQNTGRDSHNNQYNSERSRIEDILNDYGEQQIEFEEKLQRLQDKLDNSIKDNHILIQNEAALNEIIDNLKEDRSRLTSQLYSLKKSLQKADIHQTDVNYDHMRDYRHDLEVLEAQLKRCNDNLQKKDSKIKKLEAMIEILKRKGFIHEKNPSNDDNQNESQYSDELTLRLASNSQTPTRLRSSRHDKLHTERERLRKYDSEVPDLRFKVDELSIEFSQLRGYKKAYIDLLDRNENSSPHTKNDADSTQIQQLRQEIEEWEMRCIEAEDTFIKNKKDLVFNYEKRITEIIQSYERQILSLRLPARDKKNNPPKNQSPADEHFDRIIFDLQGRITVLIEENERLGYLLTWNNIIDDSLEESLKKSLAVYRNGENPRRLLSNEFVDRRRSGSTITRVYFE